MALKLAIATASGRAAAVLVVPCAVRGGGGGGGGGGLSPLGEKCSALCAQPSPCSTSLLA